MVLHVVIIDGVQFINRFTHLLCYLPHIFHTFSTRLHYDFMCLASSTVSHDVTKRVKRVHVKCASWGGGGGRWVIVKTQLTLDLNMKYTCTEAE